MGGRGWRRGIPLTSPSTSGPQAPWSRTRGGSGAYPSPFPLPQAPTPPGVAPGEALGHTPHPSLHLRPPGPLESYPGRLWDPWTLCIHLCCAHQARQQQQQSGQPSKHRTEPLLLNTKYPPGRPTQQSLLQQEACGRTGQASHGGALPGTPWGKAEGPGVGRWWGPA